MKLLTLLLLAITANILFAASCNPFFNPGVKPNKPPVVKINLTTGDTVTLQEVVTTLTGKVEGDSIIATLWCLQTDTLNKDVFIESPDSLITKVYIRKKGKYNFIFAVQNIRDEMDTAHTSIIVW